MEAHTATRLSPGLLWTALRRVLFLIRGCSFVPMYRR